mgnify:FL=1
MGAFIFVLLFHGINFLIFSIGIFPALSISLTLLFFAPEFPRNMIEWLRSKTKLVGKLETWWQKQLDSWGSQKIGAPDYWQNAPNWRPVISIAIILVCIFHLLVPFRHHLFPGNVAWTEEGHRYSWRMMLRSKHAYGQYVIVKENGTKERIKPQDLLSPKQARKVFTHPDMILQFAHHLRDQYEVKGEAVEVYAEVKVKLNHRKYQEYIRPDVDLAKVEWSMFKHSDWILPLEEQPE